VRPGLGTTLDAHTRSVTHRTSSGTPGEQGPAVAPKTQRASMTSFPPRDARGYPPGVVLAVPNRRELSESTSIYRRIRSGRKQG
jgi:hypothetical protein